MIKLNNRIWKDFSFNDLFRMKNGYFHKHPSNQSHGTIPFLAATDSNNGVTAMLTKDIINKSTKSGHGANNAPFDRKIDYGPSIAVTNNGSIGHAYYCNYSYFAASDDITILSLRNKILTKNIAMFLIPCIEKQGELFHYARKWKLLRMIHSRIMLPVDINNKPDWDFMIKYTNEIIKKKNEKRIKFIYKSLPKHKLYSLPKLENKNWNKFYFDDLFHMTIGFYGKRPKEDKDGTIPLLGSTDSNNGVTEYLTKESIKTNAKTPNSVNVSINNKIYNGPLIALTNSGSVGHAYYQAGIFTATSHITILKLKVHDLTKNIALFIIPSIEKQRKMFSFSRSWNINRMKKSRLLLPVDNNNNIDWQYIEHYIENIKQEKRKKLLNIF